MISSASVGTESGDRAEGRRGSSDKCFDRTPTGLGASNGGLPTTHSYMIAPIA